jgi:hypothetical protein
MDVPCTPSTASVVIQHTATAARSANSPGRRTCTTRRSPSSPTRSAPVRKRCRVLARVSEFSPLYTSGTKGLGAGGSLEPLEGADLDHASEDRLQLNDAIAQERARLLVRIKHHREVVFPRLQAAAQSLRQVLADSERHRQGQEVPPRLPSGGRVSNGLDGPSQGRLGVSDLEHSIAFYHAVLVPLGYVRIWSDSDAAGYGCRGQPDEPFAIKRESSNIFASGQRFHVAFASRSPEAVLEFHATALANGAVDDGAQGCIASTARTTSRRSSSIRWLEPDPVLAPMPRIAEAFPKPPVTSGSLLDHYNGARRFSHGAYPR